MKHTRVDMIAPGEAVGWVSQSRAHTDYTAQHTHPEVLTPEKWKCSYTEACVWMLSASLFLTAH